MLALSTVKEIDRLLQEGALSHRQIAARLGVGRGSVDAIASGRRPLVGKEVPPPGLASITSCGRPQRCPTCGHRVYAPCQVCAARSYRESQRAIPAGPCRTGIDEAPIPGSAVIEAQTAVFHRRRRRQIRDTP